MEICYIAIWTIPGWPNRLRSVLETGEGRDSALGKVTFHGMDGPGIEFQWAV